MLLALPGAVPEKHLAVLGEAPTDPDAALRELVRSRLEALGPVTVETLARGARPTRARRAARARGTRAARRRDARHVHARGRGRGRVVRAAPARANSSLHAETPAQRDRARDARRFPTVPVPLARSRRRSARRPRGARGRDRRAPRLRVAGRALGARGVTRADRRLWPRAARSALRGRRGRLVAAAAEWRAAAGPRDHGRDLADCARAAHDACTLASARRGGCGARGPDRRGRARRGRARGARRVVLRRDRAGERSAARAGRGRARRARRARAGDCGLVPRAACRSHAAEPTPRFPRARPATRHGRVRRRGPVGAARSAKRRRVLDASRLSSTPRWRCSRRYGVIARALLAREALAPSWRELLPIYRRAEARGEIRGGRFVEPLGGEQFALIEAVEELRRVRRTQGADEWLELSTADPLNLTSVVGDSARTFAPARKLVFRNGAVVAAESAPRDLAARAPPTVPWRRHSAPLASSDFRGGIGAALRAPCASRSARRASRRAARSMAPPIARNGRHSRYAMCRPAGEILTNSAAAPRGRRPLFCYPVPRLFGPLS